MRRTQLYLDDNLWTALRARAKRRKTTVSELVREAVCESCLGKQDERMKAMQKFMGIRKERPGDPAAVEYVRSPRLSNRLDRFRQG